MNRKYVEFTFIYPTYNLSASFLLFPSVSWGVLSSPAKELVTAKELQNEIGSF